MSDQLNLTSDTFRLADRLVTKLTNWSQADKKLARKRQRFMTRLIRYDPASVSSRSQMATDNRQKLERIHEKLTVNCHHETLKTVMDNISKMDSLLELRSDLKQTLLALILELSYSPLTSLPVQYAHASDIIDPNCSLPEIESLSPTPSPRSSSSLSWSGCGNSDVDQLSVWSDSSDPEDYDTDSGNIDTPTDSLESDDRPIVCSLACHSMSPVQITLDSAWSSILAAVTRPYWTKLRPHSVKLLSNRPESSDYYVVRELIFAFHSPPTVGNFNACLLSPQLTNSLSVSKLILEYASFVRHVNTLRMFISNTHSYSAVVRAYASCLDHFINEDINLFMRECEAECCLRKSRYRLTKFLANVKPHIVTVDAIICHHEDIVSALENKSNESALMCQLSLAVDTELRPVVRRVLYRLLVDTLTPVTNQLDSYLSGRRTVCRPNLDAPFLLGPSRLVDQLESSLLLLHMTDTELTLDLPQFAIDFDGDEDVNPLTCHLAEKLSSRLGMAKSQLEQAVHSKLFATKEWTLYWHLCRCVFLHEAGDVMSDFLVAVDSALSDENHRCTFPMLTVLLHNCLDRIPLLHSVLDRIELVRPVEGSGLPFYIQMRPAWPLDVIFFTRTTMDKLNAIQNWLHRLRRASRNITRADPRQSEFGMRSMILRARLINFVAHLTNYTVDMAVRPLAELFDVHEPSWRSVDLFREAVDRSFRRCLLHPTAKVIGQPASTVLSMAENFHHEILADLVRVESLYARCHAVMTSNLIQLRCQGGLHHFAMLEWALVSTLPS